MRLPTAIECTEPSGVWEGKSFEAKRISLPGRVLSMAQLIPLRNLQDLSFLQAAFMRRGVWPDMPGAVFALCLLTISQEKVVSRE